jgi:hypothetical protein
VPEDKVEEIIATSNAEAFVEPDVVEEHTYGFLQEDQPTVPGYENEGVDDPSTWAPVWPEEDEVAEIVDVLPDIVYEAQEIVDYVADSTLYDDPIE